MKSIYLSVFAAVALLFTACGSDESIGPDTPQTGNGILEAKIAFAGIGDQTTTKAAAESNAIPTTGWYKIGQVNVIIYDQNGKVTYSKVMDPSVNKTVKWTDVPTGQNLTIAVIANVKNGTDNIATFIAGTETIWGQGIKGQTLNSSLKIDLKKKANEAFEGPYEAKKEGNKAYYAPSEIFAAYEYNVEIAEGVAKQFTFNLTREVAMMRVRIDQTSEAKNNASMVKFGTASASILVQRQTTGFALPVANTDGGSILAIRDDKRVVEVTGATIFNTTDPAKPANDTSAGYVEVNASGIVANGGTPKILKGNYTLWSDVIVLPNVTKTEGFNASSEDVGPGKQYRILISAEAQPGYLPYGATEALQQATTVYWTGMVKGAFVGNNIREVNLKLLSPGTTTPGGGIESQGNLEITLGDPMDWNTAIQTETVEL